MKAVILLAGRGIRLRPYSKVFHKSLLPIGDKTLLYYTLNNLLFMNIKDMCFVLGDKARSVRQYIDTNFPSIRKTYILNELYSTTNSIYSYFLSINYFNNQDFIRLDGDLLFPKTILPRLCTSGYSLVTPVQKIKKKDLSDYTVVVDKEKQRILRLDKNISTDQSYGFAMAIEYINAKASRIISQSLRNLIDKGVTNQIAEYVYGHLLDSSLYYNYIPLQLSEQWCDIDNLSDYKYAQRIFKSYNKLEK